MTLLALKLLALNAIAFVQRHWRLFAGGVLLLAALLFILRACNPSPKPITIDEQGLSKINSQNATERRKALEETIYDNAETVKTVEGRTTIAESNVVERQREVDKRVTDAEKKIEAVKAQKGDVTASELECILTGACQ